MLVEDDVSLRMLFQEELQDDGFEVLTAGNGEEAVRQFDQGNFDLIIMDIVMPVMDGIEAMHRLKERNGEVPIIFHSSFPKYQMDPRTKGAAAFIIKSSDSKELKEKIRYILEKKLEGDSTGGAPNSLS